MAIDTAKESKDHIYDSSISFISAVAASFRSTNSLRSSWQHFLSPLYNLGIVFFFISAFLDGLFLYKAKNKNLGKLLSFLLSTSIAIVWIFFVFFAPQKLAIILAVSMAVSFVYTLIKLGYSLYKWMTSSSESEKSYYRQESIEQAINLLASTIFIVLFISAASMSLIGSAVLAGIATLLFIVISIQCLCKAFSMNSSKTTIFPSQNKAICENKSPAIESSLYTVQAKIINQQDKGPPTLQKECVGSFSKFYENYYGVNNRLNLTGNSNEDRKKLILEAYNQILVLRDQISLANTNRSEGFWSQTSKRYAKLNVYKCLLVFSLPKSVPDALKCLQAIKMQHKELTEIVNACEVLFQEGRMLLGRNAKVTTDAKTGANYSLEEFDNYVDNLKDEVHQSFYKKISATTHAILDTRNFLENLSSAEVINTSNPSEKNIDPVNTIFSIRR